MNGPIRLNLADISSSSPLLLLHFLLIFALLIRIGQANDRPTLYAPGDNVLELDVNTFDKTVYHKPTAFFIEFYSSWCGHCIEYKPHFVRFATMLKEWRQAVVVGVINCADELNAPVCRKHAIDAFPTLKYFHVNSKGQDDAIRFDGDKKDLPLMASKITEWAKADFDAGRTPADWPQLKFEEDNSKSLSSLWASANPGSNFLAVLVDKAPGTQAFSLMLNYAGDSRLSLALCSDSHPIVAHFGQVQAPGMLVFARSSPEKPVFTSSSPLESWVEMQRQLDELLAPFPKPSAPPLDSLKSGAAPQKPAEEQQPLVVDWKQFEVQYQDLMAAFHYLLTVEVPRNPVLGSVELWALKDFIHLIRQHGPGSVPVRRLFFRLDQWLAAQQQPVIATEKYLQKLEEIQSDLGHPIPSNLTFLACRGSKPIFRGYTCGLWTLFHLLTVQAYKERRNDPKFDPVSEVLQPIRQFIVQFLSCEVCSKNFDKMAQEQGLLDVHKPEEAVLWLWRAHNRVNRRLKGEAGEDPHFPKQQFPPGSLCPECWRGGGEEADEGKVLAFLLAYYSHVKIDKYKHAPSYKVHEFANGKLERVAERRLNPKFEPMAGKVDRLEQIEAEARVRAQQEEGLKRHWRPIEEDYRGISPRPNNFHLLWLLLIALGLFLAYFQYRRNRSKFWKLYYNYNDYKVLPWSSRLCPNSSQLMSQQDKYSA